MANSIPICRRAGEPLTSIKIDRGGRAIISRDTMPVIFKRGLSG